MHLNKPMKTITLYTDGYYPVINGKNEMVYGYVVIDNSQIDPKVVECKELAGFEGTSNVAEYVALIKGLEYIITNMGTEVSVDALSDSQLVVCQVKGQYKIRKEHLRPFLNQVIELSKKFKSFNIKWISRKLNLAGEL